jgi:hypothetical protein
LSARQHVSHGDPTDEFPFFFWSFSFGEAKEKRAGEMQELRQGISVREPCTLKEGLFFGALKSCVSGVY